MPDPTPTHALSIRQPWAWLIAHGHKDVENRTWQTNHRGYLWIHAGQTFDREGYDWVRMHFSDVPMPHHLSFERGGIVGRARLVDVVEASESPWFFGPYGFLLEDTEPVELLPTPGRLGLFNLSRLDREVLAAREASHA